ncbi:MAG: hypothetical protein JWL64_1890 [Frankiales bacterium]|nr:hypothetical protein [Frankiales bacterium]
MTARHVPFYLALELMSDAWARLLVEGAGGALVANDVGVVAVDYVFKRELFVGDAEVDAEVAAIGRSSVAFDTAITQGGIRACSGRITVARTDEARLHSVPLSEVQRAALQPLVS